jgi:hypothetical protein
LSEDDGRSVERLVCWRESHGVRPSSHLLHHDCGSGHRLRYSRNFERNQGDGCRLRGDRAYEFRQGFRVDHERRVRLRVEGERDLLLEPARPGRGIFLCGGFLSGAGERRRHCVVG